MHFLPDHVFDYGRKAWRESPKKRRDALKRAILTKKSKIFIKAKLTVSKSCLLGLLGFLIFCILRGDLLQITKYLCNLSVTMTIFLTKKSKNFIKAKLTVSESCLLGLLGFLIFLNFKGWPFINHKISLQIFWEILFFITYIT